MTTTTTVRVESEPRHWAVVGEVLVADEWTTVTLTIVSTYGEAIDAADRMSYAEEPVWRRLRVAPYPDLSE